MKLAVPVAFAALLALGIAYAADPGSLSKADRKFVEKAAQAGLAEVEAAKLAKLKAEGQEVKDFARQMEEDHTKANDELAQLASAKGVNLPQDTDRKHHRAMDELRHHTAAQFEREYMNGQVSDHKSVIHLFEREAKGGHDADLKKWASDKLPALRHHLEMAEAARKGSRAEHLPAAKQPKASSGGAMAK